MTKHLMFLSLVLLCSLGWSAAARSANPSPCALLAPAEVEAVIGPLAGPPFRASRGFPNPNGDTCRYETPELRAVELRVEWQDGGESFAMMNMMQGVVDEGGLKNVVTLSDGTELVGEWDEARTFMCCEFEALRGEQLVAVDISGSRATLEQAAALADAAVKRLDAPLTVDDGAAVAAAREREDARPKPRPVCELVTRAEAEEIVGAPLLADPVGDERSCNYAWNAPEGYEFELEMEVTWRGGFSELRQAQDAIGNSLSFFESQGVDLNMEQQANSDFDEEFASIVGLMAVRKDVLFNVDTGGMMNDVARAFLVKAASKL